MADRTPLAGHADSDLELRLIDLGPGLYPTTPDLAPRVRRRLESELADNTLSPPPGEPLIPSATRSAGTRPLGAGRREYGPRGGKNGGKKAPLPVRWERGWGEGLLTRAGDEGQSWGGGVRTRTAWLLAAILLIAIAGGFVLFPEARNAIADRLGLKGVLMRWVDEVPTPEPSRVGSPLLLGRPVSLEDAQAAVDFPVLVPAAAGFNTPQEIYLLDQDQGAMVSFVYPAGPGLPETDETGVGALLTQFTGEADRDLIEKGLLIDGALETHLEAVTVGGKQGFWISGAPHAFFVVCYDAGECRQERYRLAGNVLIWEQEGVTLRLESALSREDALAIAESIVAPE